MSDIIYEAHLRAFLTACEDMDVASRVTAAARVLEILDEMDQAWSALLDLAVADMYAAGVKQGEIGELLGKTRQMASIRAAHGKKNARTLNRVVAATKRAAHKINQ